MHHRKMKVLGMARQECCFLSCGYKKKDKSNSFSSKTLMVKKSKNLGVLSLHFIPSFAQKKNATLKNKSNYCEL